MQVRAPVAVLGKLHPADARHVLDGVGHGHDELPHLGGEVAGQRGQVVVLERPERDHDRKPGVAREREPPPVVGPHGGGVVVPEATSAPAVGLVLAAPRGLLGGRGLQGLEPQALGLVRIDVPAGHLLDGDREAALAVRGDQDPRVVVLDALGLHDVVGHRASMALAPTAVPTWPGARWA